MHIRLSVNWTTKKTITKKFDIEKLKEHTDKIAYIEAVDKLSERIENHIEVDQLWENIENSMKKVVSESLGYKGKENRKKWFNDRCKLAITKRDAARLKLIKTPNEDNRKQLAIQQRTKKGNLNRKKRQWEMNRIQDIEMNYKTNAEVSFGRYNEIKTGYKPRMTILQQTDGTMITDGSDVVEKFREMFEELLNKPMPEQLENHRVVSTEQQLNEPTKEEIQLAIKMLKNGKAPGEDNLTVELLKHGGGGNTFTKLMEQFIKKLWKDKKIHEAWIQLYALFTRMGISWISLLDLSYKILSNILLTRL